MATDSEELSDVDESEEVSEEVSEQVSDEGSGSEDMSDLQEMDHPYLGICFASLPTDVLHSFCRVLQLGAYTTKAMRAYAEILRIYGPDFPEDLLPPRPTVEAVPLRLCCKELAVAYDFVRPCIRFPMEDMDAVGSYLQKLPNLVTVAIDCDKQSSCASKCLSDLYGILPELQRLAVRHKPSVPKTSPRLDFASTHISCLLPWHQTLHHLELLSMRCVQGKHNPLTDHAHRPSDTQLCNNMGFLSSLSALTSLHLDNTQPLVTSEDLAGCPALQVLYIRMPEILPHNQHYPLDTTTLELPACTLLRELHCESCLLTSIDVSACSLLEVLDVSRNEIKHLDLSRNPLLKTVSAVTNRLQRLDLTSCSALKKVSVGNNPLTTLLVAGCTALKELSLSETDLADLDLSGCTGLTEFGIGYYPPLSSITLTGCTALERLELSKIELVSLDLTGLTGLKKLICKLANMSTLTLTGCTSLASLDVDAAVLDSLDLAGCAALKEVLLEGCAKLETVNLAGCSALQLFDCRQCKVGELDLTPCGALLDLHVSENNLRVLDVSPCPLLVTLDCSFNPLEGLCTAGCRNLVSVNCSSCAQKRWGKGKKATPKIHPEAITVVEVPCPQHEGTCARLY